MQDRYSEYTGSEYTGSEYNGSEYSYGGMGSRTGSFSSLIEESDWNTDFRMNYDDPNSPSSAAEGINDMGEITASASSLMQQIEALALRADADFSLWELYLLEFFRGEVYNIALMDMEVNVNFFFLHLSVYLKTSQP